MTKILKDKILSMTQVRQNFSQILNEVRNGQPITIHHHKHDDVTIISRNFILELLELLEEK